MDPAGPKRDLRGFSLVELIIVVAIVGILAAVAVPRFARFQLKAKTAEAIVNLKAISIAEQTYWSEFGSYVSTQVSPAMWLFLRPQRVLIPSASRSPLRRLPTGRARRRSSCESGGSRD